MDTAGPSRSRRPPHIMVNSRSGRDLLMSDLNSPGSTSTPLNVPQQGVPQNIRLGHGHGQSSQNLTDQWLYSAAAIVGSTEKLLRPVKTRAPRPYQDISESSSRVPSAMSSRRTSFSSDGARSRDSRLGPFASPFDDSRALSWTEGMDDGNITTQTVSEKYNITPSEGLLLYPEDIEKDDWLHNPDPNDSDREQCNIWNKRGMMNVGGLALITLGVLILFVGYPIITFIRQQLPHLTSCASDPRCLSDKLPLLKNVRSGLIDPDTPQSAMTKTAKDGTKLQLVFSDEFNTPGRTFHDGDDPFFQAVDIWYGATQDLEWYDPDAVSTANGTLNIRFDAFQSHNLNYRSGMVQSWNKICFKGGRMEASISLPGRGDIEGFWPGFWAMGNLGRPGYLATADGLWPYSYWDKCDVGITKNQSSPDGLSLLPGMRLPACTCSGQDHPSPGVSRSAPEIDALEASVGFMGPGQFGGAAGTASQSFQAAPFDIWYQPDYSFLEIYDMSVTSMNSYRGGPYQQALSGVTWLNNKWYDGNAYQLYGFEYTPGESGNISWFVGSDYTWHMDHRSIRPNGNIGQRIIPQEPMSIVLNFGLSNSFAEVFLANLAQLMPATMRIDYIRIYQDPQNVMVTCDPPGYPTTEYIKKHPAPYSNPNLTLWSATEHPWPKNTFVDGCTA